MKMIRALPLGCLLVLAPVVGAQAGMGEMVGKCENCHGKGGNGDDLKVPNIAGMSETYLTDTLTAYRDGDRPGVKYKPKDGNETDMATVAGKLGDDDIAALAKHFAGQAFKPQAQPSDAALAAKGAKLFDKACEKCHSDGGTVADDDAGLLAGQGRAYLEQQFRMFADGSRSMPKKMKKKFKKLDDGRKAAIIEFLVAGGK